MKIVICASMSAAIKVLQVASQLEEFGHVTVIPKNIDKYASGEFILEDSNKSIENKIKDDLIRDYYQEIHSADAVLVVNEDKRGVADYIGGNVFLEIGFAHVLDKAIFLLNPIPEVSYRDEIIAMQPIIVNGDLSKIK